MTDIAIVPAGAGAGKTHHIKTTLGQWVSAGDVAPRKILAVTFTEAAAGELRQRIRTELLAAGNIEAALEVEQAYVTTIHALGQRLLGEHALAHGASPHLRLIEEAEQDLLLRRCLEAAPTIGQMASNLAAHGYSFEFNSGASAEEVFRKAFLKLVETLRTLGPRGCDPVLAEQAAQSVYAAYGPVTGTNADTADALRRSIDALLHAFPGSIASSVTAKTVKSALRDDHKALLAAQRSLLRGEKDWKVWERLRKLQLSNSRTKLPEEYEALAGAVLSVADALPCLPGPRDDAMHHARELVRAAQQVMTDYGHAKAALGVIDYGDMITNAAAMLASRSDVTEAILAEIDCVVIDEFQDTSPIQFAFLWQLAAQAPRTLIVGDTKQAIMGFQGADPRLAEALAKAHPHPALPNNWRSVAPIMEFVNVLGPRLFGDRYSPLAPMRASGPTAALEVIEQDVTGRETKADTAKPSHIVAERIGDILKSGEMTIEDRHTKEVRALEPRDIAVLCQTGKQCAEYAGKLRALGLPVRLAEDGWWNSPVIQAAGFALGIVANPDDRHAALCFASLGPDQVDLGIALSALAAGKTVSVTGMDSLVALHDEAGKFPVDAVVAQIISKAGLRQWCDNLPDPLQMRADLGRLEAEAAAFSQGEIAPREAAGFYGNGIAVFLGWLQARVDQKDDSRPHASGNQSDGIEVVTWHSSKGREWPLVVVATLGHERNPRAREFRVEIPDFSDFNAILEQASLSYAPSYAASEATDRALNLRREDAREECRRLLYVALTRARDRLVIEWPKPPSKGWKEGNICPAQMLEEECGFALAPSGILLEARLFPARKVVGGKEIPPEFLAATENAGLPVRAVRHALRLGIVPHADSILAPSAVLVTARPQPGELVTISLAPGVSLKNAELTKATEKGTALHEALRICLQRPDLMHKVAAHCRISEVEANAVLEQASFLRSALAARGFPTLHVEQPLDVTLADGTAQTIILDLLAEGPLGFMIVDHKSGPVSDARSRYATYWPQLAAYSDAVDRLGTKPVTHAAIFWTHTGELSVGTICNG